METGRLIISRTMRNRLSSQARQNEREARDVGLREARTGRVVSVAGGLHVDLGAEAELGSSAGIVEFENHALALAYHAKDRPCQRIASKLVIIEVGVTHDEARPGCGVVSLDDALHEMNRRLGLSRP